MKQAIMEHRILVTLGPSSLKENIISSMTKESVYLFRINLSHTQIEDLENAINIIKNNTDVPVCLDSEGAQIRNRSMENDGLFYRAGNKVKIHYEQVVGDQENISFTPEYIASQLEVSDEISIDFNSALFKVKEKNNNHCIAEVVMGGFVGSNKAANVSRPIKLDTITIKDKQAIEIGRQLGIKNFALSFANSFEDVEEMRTHIGIDSELISKVESFNGLTNLDGIIEFSDEILIDRGDLSREVPLVKIHFLQRRIISLAKSKRTPVYVATNLLESMIDNINPTRAEINDVVSTLLMGADGLVLAAETAIGKFPLGSVRNIRSLIEEVEVWTPNTSIDELLQNYGQRDKSF